ncbi:hypothetical protein ACNRBH_16225, partial [Ralstonia pseudosolanacearum]|uniref:hypothetical protein n=2 Tax=Ralstonia pseudosolanacearum TaxID=1310165 RepID=UPI003AADDEE2
GIHNALQEASVDASEPRKKSSTGEVMVSQQRMLDDAQTNRSFMDNLLESVPPAPMRSPGAPAKTERGAARSDGASETPEPQPATSDSDWTADFDADMEESLADLM